MSTAFDQKKKRQRRVRWAVGVVVMWALVEGGYAAGGALSASEDDRGDRAQAGQSWANLKRCLVGDGSVTPTDAIGRLATLRYQLKHRADGSDEGADFPERCAEYAQSLTAALSASRDMAFTQPIYSFHSTLEQGHVSTALDHLWASLDSSLPGAEASDGVPPPPELAPELVPPTKVISLGGDSLEHGVRSGDPSNGGMLAIRFETTRRMCVFADQLRSAQCAFDANSLPDSLFRRDTRFGSSEPGGLPWLAFRDYETGVTLFDAWTGDVLRRAEKGHLFDSVLASHGVHWIIELEPTKRLLRRNAAGEVDDWPLPPNAADVRLIQDYVLSAEPKGPQGTQIVARQLPKEEGGLGPPETILERAFELSFSESRLARRGADASRVIVDAPTHKLLISHRDGKWSEVESEDLSSDAVLTFEREQVHLTRVAPTYVEIMTCREAGCQKKSYEARLGDGGNAAVYLGEQVALLSWESGSVWLTVAKPDALRGAPRRWLLAADQVSGARLWGRGRRALALLETSWGILPIAFDASGEVWPVQIEDVASSSP